MFALFAIALAYGQETPAPTDPVREKRLEWWREARFGMMIHWGLYSIPAGELEREADTGHWRMDHEPGEDSSRYL